MFNRRKLLTLALVFGAAATSQAQTGSTTMIRAFGTVNVNGNPVTGWASISPGDKVDTGSGSAVIMSGNSQMQIDPNTSLIFGGDSTELGCGEASLVGTGIAKSLKVQGLTIVNQSATGKVSVSNSGGKILVHSISGAASVTESGKTSTVAESATASFASPGTCVANAQNNARSGAPATSAHSLKGPIILGTAAAGGVTAAVILATRGDDKPSTSPSAP